MKNQNSVYDAHAHDRALISLVLSIVGLLLCGPFTSSPAIVCAVRARRAGNREAVGIIGLILGIIGVVIFAIAVFFVIIVLLTPDGAGAPLPTGGFIFRS